MITEGNGGIAAGPGDHKRWERGGKAEGSGAVTGTGSWIVCVKSERCSSSENSSSENLNFVFYKSVSGALGEQTNVYCNFAKLHEQYYAIWEIKKTHKTASVPAATGHPDQRHWFKKQRGKWEKSYTFWFENSPDGKDFSSQSPCAFHVPKDMKGYLYSDWY